ncbi:uncharacterized protein LOC124929567 [Impatiens glandulifera]|uniref:uncharacterized protein LOC124929567 n=1 Tax=Impatiens glandulifera TaxID=253017 RepID=UPI001FB0CA00|nr:uncharacterized protein LOC124929567 [Impatiens glandulifera]
MGSSMERLRRSLPFSRLFRQLENEVETVINVLQPGPLGIVEHKFTEQEIQQAKITVKRAVKNWNMNAKLEGNGGILEGYIHK